MAVGFRRRLERRRSCYEGWRQGLFADFCFLRFLRLRRSGRVIQEVVKGANFRRVSSTRHKGFLALALQGPRPRVLAQCGEDLFVLGELR